MSGSEPFQRTLRALEGRGRGPLLAISVGVLICSTAWLAWMWLAEVPVHVVSTDARIESAHPSFGVVAPVSGRIEVFAMRLGDTVSKGQVLVRMNDDAEKHDETELNALVDGLNARISALDEQIAAEEKTLALSERAAVAASERAISDAQGATVLAEAAEAEAQRATALERTGAGTEVERARWAAEASSRRATARSAKLAQRQLALSLEKQQSEIEARIAALAVERAEIVADAAAAKARLDRVRAELARREVRAPFDGVIGEVGGKTVGQQVAAGEQLATVVPLGDLQIVAHFDAREVGRLAAGQVARMRVDAFPWIEYGAIAAYVESVATEPRDGGVRTELRVSNAQQLALAHGQTGTVEVQVEVASPMSLLLRSAGIRLGESVSSQ